MAKLKIYTYPDLVLGQKALPIARVDKSYFKMADDMLETMYAAPGIGLAANQVGILQRILLLDTDYDYEELEDELKAPVDAEIFGTSVVRNKNPRIIINPRIILQEGKTSIEEGCLSFPEFTVEVPRSEKIKIEYQDIDGLMKTLSADGLLAIAIQHEIDHLDGRVFIDRLSPLKKEMAQKKLRKERAERDARLLRELSKK